MPERSATHEALPQGNDRDRACEDIKLDTKAKLSEVRREVQTQKLLPLKETKDAQGGVFYQARVNGTWYGKRDGETALSVYQPQMQPGTAWMRKNMPGQAPPVEYEWVTVDLFSQRRMGLYETGQQIQRSIDAKKQREAELLQPKTIQQWTNVIDWDGKNAVRARVNFVIPRTSDSGLAPNSRWFFVVEDGRIARHENGDDEWLDEKSEEYRVYRTLFQKKIDELKRFV